MIVFCPSFQGKPAGTIAHRTRSKFPIEIPLQEIEANFVAPDVSMDMYDKGIEDVDWQKWLASLFHDNAGKFQLSYSPLHLVANVIVLTNYINFYFYFFNIFFSPN